MMLFIFCPSYTHIMRALMNLLEAVLAISSLNVESIIAIKIYFLLL